MSPGAETPVPRRGIERRVITLVLTGMVATVGLLGAVGYREFRALEAEARHSRLAVATGAASHLDELIGGLMGELQGLSGAPSLVEFLDGTAPPGDADLRDLYLRSGVLDGTFIADAAGAIVVAVPSGSATPAHPTRLRAPWPPAVPS